MVHKLIVLIGTCLALMLTEATTQAKGWRGIVPLKSTRADVERLLGQPGQHGRYQFDNERAYVEYAGSGPCHPANTCLCLVPEDTVISIYVELEVEMRFSLLKLDRKKYKKTISSNNPDLATYSNNVEGIIYTVDEKNDDVSVIEYSPTAKDCRRVIRNRAKPGRNNARSKPLRNRASLDAAHSAC